MAADPELVVAETRAWLVKASNGISCRQQAAEKIPRGFLTWNGRTFRRTHNLEEIGEQCLTIDASLREVVDQSVPLSEYAWKFRYPGEPGAPAADEVVEVVATARMVFEAVLNRLPPDVHP